MGTTILNFNEKKSNNFSTKIVKIEENYLNKFKNFYFLTNESGFYQSINSNYFQVYRTATGHIDTINSYKKKKNYRLKKNTPYSALLAYYFRTFCKNKNFIFTKHFAFSHSFIVINLLKKKSTKAFKIQKSAKYLQTLKNNSNFFFFSENLFYKSIPLIGSLIIPNEWDFSDKKNWMKREMTVDVRLNIDYEWPSLDKRAIKLIYFNNFLYFADLNIDFVDFKYLVEITTPAPKFNNFDVDFAKPYSFLSLPESYFESLTPFSIFLLSLFKQYQKLFSLSFEHFNQKSWIDLWFQENFNFINDEQSISYCTPLFINKETTEYFETSKWKTVDTLDPFFFYALNEKVQQYYFSLSKALKLVNLSCKSQAHIVKKIEKQLFLLDSETDDSATEQFLSFFSDTDFNDFSNQNIIFDTEWESTFVFFHLSSLFTDEKNQKILLCFFLFKQISKVPTGSSIEYFEHVEHAQSNNLISDMVVENHFTPLIVYFYFNITKSQSDPFTFNFSYSEDTLTFFNETTFNFSTILVFNEPLDFDESILTIPFNLPLILQKENVTFTLSVWGFLYLTCDLFINTFLNTQLHNLKRNAYSFAMTNEVQKFILKKYVKNLSVLNMEEDNLDSDEEEGSILLSNNEDCWLWKPLSNLTSLFFEAIPSNKWRDFAYDMKYQDKFEESLVNLNIKKTKFKPGYMNIWRESRRVLKLLLNVNFKYQYKLTRYITRYNKFNRFDFFLYLEMRLDNILLKTRLAYDTKSSSLFIREGLVFINGFNCLNSSFQVQSGDFIQLIVNIKYYIIFRWLTHWIYKKQLKLKIKTKKKSLSYLTSDEKMRSFLMPAWILNNIGIVEDVAKFMEIDYFTLSAFIIYDPFLLNDLTIYNFINIRYGVMRLYNWKYIN